jgi:uncharacterized protein YbjT (DUF2867 family)
MTMITVFGASGNTGGVVAATLLENGKKVRAVGRHPERLAALVKAGAETAVGDIEDAGFVRQALDGAEGAYVLIPPNMGANDFRGYQQRVVEAVGAGVEATGLRHLVLLSSIGAQHATGTGPIVGVHSFEQRLNAIATLNALYLRAGFFMENVLMGLGSVKSTGVYGGPMPAEAAVAMIAAADIGRYAGTRLARLDFTGKQVVHLLGPKAFSQNELVETLTRAVGKPVRYVQVSLDVIEKGLQGSGVSPSTVAVFMEMYRAAGQGLVAPEQGGPVEHGVTSFETFAKKVFTPAFHS